AGAITREHASRAVGAVCGGRQSQDQQAGLWIAEAGNGLSPIRPVAIGAPLYGRDLPAVSHQPRTSLASDDLRLKYFKRSRHERDSPGITNSEVARLPSRVH